mmetsp:Transcript_26125/g.74782  ORF Transcript_26125/g.74782 Transcript_26125/m.74782 type:complete len:220 (+) Transcript_26125:397-1056(+)
MPLSVSTGRPEGSFGVTCCGTSQVPVSRRKGQILMSPCLWASMSSAADLKGPCPQNQMAVTVHCAGSELVVFNLMFSGKGCNQAASGRTGAGGNHWKIRMSARWPGGPSASLRKISSTEPSLGSKPANCVKTLPKEATRTGSMILNVRFTRPSPMRESALFSVGLFTYGMSPLFVNCFAVALAAIFPPSMGPTRYSSTPVGPTAVTRAKRGGLGPLPSR